MPFDAYCKGCAYLGTNSMGKCCDYNFVTGKVRGCPAGEGCNRREYGPRRRYTFSFGTPQNAENARKSSITSGKSGRPRKPPEELDEKQAKQLERKRLAAEACRAKAQGRQREVLMAYKAKHNVSCADIAYKIGVNPSTVQKWCTEYMPARWDLLEKIGIQKPEGID